MDYYYSDGLHFYKTLGRRALKVMCSGMDLCCIETVSAGSISSTAKLITKEEFEEAFNKAVTYLTRLI